MKLLQTTVKDAMIKAMRQSITALKSLAQLVNKNMNFTSILSGNVRTASFGLQVLTVVLYKTIQ